MQAFAKNHNAKQTAQDFSVSRWTVYRLRQQMERTGSVDLRVNQRGRKAKLTQQDMEAIDALVQKRSDLTIREIKETLQLNACEETVRKAVIKLGYPFRLQELVCLCRMLLRFYEIALMPRSFPRRKDKNNHASWSPPSWTAFKPLRSCMETLPSTRTS